MKSFNKYLYLVLILLNLNSFIVSNNAQELDVVDHKNGQLALYLDAIRYNLQEKIGILPFLLKQPSGIYLEIGTGGDPIAELFRQIPQDADVLLIASDVDVNVLNSLELRHPELKKYLDAKSGLRLNLQQLNAINMSVFPDNHLNGINASSVLHEIISYAGGLDACQQFFKEAYRTLKPGGVLVYRDPECVINKNNIVTVSLKNRTAKLFAHVFIYKFLDSRGSMLARAGRKVCMYSSENVQFSIYKKNEMSPTLVSFQQYLQIPSYDIDFSRKYEVTMPQGLYRELARHYLTYLHLNNPLVFVKSVSGVSQDTYFVNYWAHSTFSVLKTFLKSHSQNFENNQITEVQKNMIEDEIVKNSQVLEFGIPLKFSSKLKEAELRQLLQNNAFNPSNHIIAVDSKTFLLDYRVFGLLYEDILNIFDKFNGLIRPEDENHALWLKREGEESYCYYSADELISLVLETTFEESGNVQSCMVLCPLNEEHNFFVNRACYSELLKETLDVYDNLGYPIEVFDGKRIVNFQKMPLEQAIKECEKIIQSSPLGYPCLQKVVQNIYETFKN